MINHTSFMDTLTFMAHVPPTVMLNTNTFAKASLARLPILGTLVCDQGLFPVHFSSERENDFKVDREAQDSVQKESDAFLRRGGNLALFPEGAVNRNPRVLKEFRLGSFKKIMENKMNVYYLVTVGNNEVWPPNTAGGLPRDVWMFLGKMNVDYSDPHLTPERLAQRLRAEMQQKLDDIFRMRDEKS
jgi:1-acyl-sn-glycerol-3-phosphate acyltransferase